jgi:hypothetical protein
MPARTHLGYYDTTPSTCMAKQIHCSMKAAEKAAEDIDCSLPLHSNPTPVADLPVAKNKKPFVESLVITLFMKKATCSSTSLMMMTTRQTKTQTTATRTCDYLLTPPLQRLLTRKFLLTALALAGALMSPVTGKQPPLMRRTLQCPVAGVQRFIASHRALKCHKLGSLAGAYAPLWRI